MVLAAWLAATLLSGTGAPLLPIAFGSAAGWIVNTVRAAQVERAEHVTLYGEFPGTGRRHGPHDIGSRSTRDP